MLKKLLNENSIFIIIVLLFMNACSKSNFKQIEEIKTISLKKISEISAQTTDSLEVITNFSCDQWGNIYIYDNIKKKIFVFGKTGKYLTHFGRDGDGPGEFKFVSSVIPAQNKIYIIDSQKAAVITYDYNYKFISEEKGPIITIKKSIANGDSILSWYEMYATEGDKIIQKRGVGIFSDSLKLITDVHSINNEYNPYIIDPNIVESVFSINRITNDIAVSKIDSKEFEMLIFDNNYQIKKELTINLPSIPYNKETFNELQQFYDNRGKIMSKQYGKNFKVKKLIKYTRLIKDVAYDNDSNLWITTPQRRDPDKINIIIFDDHYQLEGILYTNLPLGKMSIINDTLIYFTGVKAEEREIQIYEIVKK